MPTELRVLIIIGYFDWFSGYQETAFAAALAEFTSVEVVASDRVSPGFSDGHLAAIGVQRRYHTGSTTENGVTVTRFASRELRSMVWSGEVRGYLNDHDYDLIVQIMPGQGMPVAATLSSNSAPRVVLYGDNRAMWSQLRPTGRLLKWLAFAVSKGITYAAVNSRAARTYGSTRNTVERLRLFSAGKKMEILPLPFSPAHFYPDLESRIVNRERLGFADEDVVLVSAGTLDPRTRLDWVVDAVGELLPEHPELRLLFAGLDSSAASREFADVVASSAMAGRTTLLPFVDAERLNEVFNAADIGVWPISPAITIQQGMGTGLPVLLPRNDLVDHLIRDELHNGIFHDLAPGSEVKNLVSSVKEALKRFDLGHEARQQRASSNGWLRSDSLARTLVDGYPRRS